MPKSLLMMVSVLFLFPTIAHAQSFDSIGCNQSRLRIAAVDECRKSRTRSSNEGYGAFAYYATSGWSGAYFVSAIGLFPENAGRSIKPALSEDVDRFLRTLHNDTKQAKNWVWIEPLDGVARIIRFQPNHNGLYCAAYFIDGRPTTYGYEWQYFGYVCLRRDKPLSDNEIKQGVALITVK